MKQMSLFDFVGVLVENTSLGQLDTVTDEENYLQRGEKILNLLRQTKQKKFVSSNLFEAINYKVYSSKYGGLKWEYLMNCARKIMKDRWIKACESGDYNSFFSSIGRKGVVVTKLDDYEEASRLIKSMLRDKAFYGCVSITMDDKTIYSTIGDTYLPPKKNNNNWRFTRSRNWYYLSDADYYFAQEYLFYEFRRRVQEALSCLTPEQLEDNRIAVFLSAELRDRLNYWFKDGMYHFKPGLLEKEYIYDYIKQTELPVCNSTSYSLSEEDLLPLWFMGNAPYTRDFVYARRDFLMKLFEIIYETYLDERASEKFLRKVATDYATAYQTKKAIPNKIINAMEKSGFNDYFGYVEFDEECDLEKIIIIEKEFRALQAAVFHQAERKEYVSLRFRKLGKHHAAGLYFPFYKCICVDVRHPSSFAHEYGHMLDYENGEVSKGARFYKVRAIYNELFDKFLSGLGKDDPLYKRLEGNTKYNKAYYLEPTEIFARSLEMYMVYILKIDNSLVKIKECFEYPKDERYLEAIKEFFDSFFDVASNPAATAAEI